MAFKNLERTLYEGTVRLTYTDASHRYGVSIFDEVGGWSKPKRPISVTGLMDEVLEKKGLQNWSMGLALKDLFGFYDFETPDGDKKKGFKKGSGTLWDHESDTLIPLTKEDALEVVTKASRQWIEAQRKGADIGSIVHDAVEQYISGTPFEITVDRYRESFHAKGGVFENELAMEEWEKNAPTEVALANTAFEQFKQYWDSIKVKVVSAEQIAYSKMHNISGTYDHELMIEGKGLVLADLKTTKASDKAGAPQGVYYSNFIQLGLYAMMKVEMGEQKPDDLAIFSARKEGGFNAVYASNLGLSVDYCIETAKAVIFLYNYKKQAVAALKAHGKI